MKDGSSPVAWTGTGKQELHLSSKGLPNIRMVPLIWHGYGPNTPNVVVFIFGKHRPPQRILHCLSPCPPHPPTPGCGRERDKVSSVMLTLKGRRRETSRSRERQMTTIPKRYANSREQASRSVSGPLLGGRASRPEGAIPF